MEEINVFCPNFTFSCLKHGRYTLKTLYAISSIFSELYLFTRFENYLCPLTEPDFWAVWWSIANSSIVGFVDSNTFGWTITLKLIEKTRNSLCSIHSDKILFNERYICWLNVHYSTTSIWHIKTWSTVLWFDLKFSCWHSSSLWEKSDFKFVEFEFLSKTLCDKWIVNSVICD